MKVTTVISVGGGSSDIHQEEDWGFYLKPTNEGITPGVWDNGFTGA